MSKCDYYSVNTKEILQATSIDEAVTEFIEEMECEDSELPEKVLVQGYKTLVVNENCSAFEWALDTLKENLDEDYSGEDGSDYMLSEATRKLFNEFKKAVIAEYPVWRCDPSGEAVEVVIKDYLDNQ